MLWSDNIKTIQLYLYNIKYNDKIRVVLNIGKKEEYYTEVFKCI